VVELPVPLPVVIGPVPALEQPGQPATPTAESGDLEVAPCDGNSKPADDRGDYSRGIVRRITDRDSGRPHANSSSRHTAGCPGTPHGPDETPLAQPGLKPPGGSGVDLVAEQVRQLVAYPELVRIDVAQPRSQLPAAPATHIDPRPA
jgi:hypothetical protein